MLRRIRDLVQHLSFNASLLLIDQRLSHWQTGTLVPMSTPRIPARVNVDRHSGVQRSLLHQSPSWTTHGSNLNRSSCCTRFCSPSPELIVTARGFHGIFCMLVPQCAAPRPLSTFHLRLSSCRRELRSGSLNTVSLSVARRL